MTKKSIYLLSFLLIILASCNKPQPKPVDFAEIEKVLNQQTAEWQKGNIDGFMQGYWHSDSLQFITARGIKKSYDSVSNNYKKHYDTPEKRGFLTFRDLQFQTLDAACEIVHCTGRWHIAANEKDAEKSGIFSLIFKKINGEWKIVIDHTW